MGLTRFFKSKSSQRLSDMANEQASPFEDHRNKSSISSSPSASSSSSSSSSLHTNDEQRDASVAVFSLSSSSSSSSLNELIEPAAVMSTRILPVGIYREQEQPPASSSSAASVNANEPNSASSLTKRFNTYRPYENDPLQFPSGCSNTSSSSSSSSTSLSLATKKDFLINHARAPNNPTTNANPSLPAPVRAANYASAVDAQTIEQILFNMVRFDVIKSNFCDYYQLGDFVRSGGFSDIHEGIRLSDNKRVVVKFIPKEKTKNWLMVSQKKYPAEVLLHKAVHEIQGIIHVYDYFENGQHWILVMERLRNCQDLFDYLESKDCGRLSEATARKFFQQLVHINLAMLRKGVVHRDLKSENILVDLDSESLVLIDFGASAIYKSSASYYSDFHGTKQYKSPEYILKRRYTAVPSTVWTLGVLLYDMVCGTLPFESEDDITGYKLVLKSHLSSELRNLIQRCLAPNPDRRPSLESLLEHAWVKGP